MHIRIDSLIDIQLIMDFIDEILDILQAKVWESEDRRIIGIFKGNVQIL